MSELVSVYPGGFQRLSVSIAGLSAYFQAFNR